MGHLVSGASKSFGMQELTVAEGRYGSRRAITQHQSELLSAFSDLTGLFGPSVVGRWEIEPVLTND